LFSALSGLAGFGPEQGSSASTIPDASAMSTLFSNLDGMFFRCLVDDYWTLLSVSPGCRELTGHPARDLVGNPSLSLESAYSTPIPPPIPIKTLPVIPVETRHPFQSKVGHPFQSKVGHPFQNKPATPAG
jgi:hypothetical protein